jgi:hypothetical protein
MSDVTYAYTSRGRKEKCTKNGTLCVRHPVHVVNGQVKTGHWFGSGVVKDLAANVGLNISTCAESGCENYPNSELVDNGADGNLCGLHYYKKD